ncbi:response regulator transcription factor [Pseudoalteromonas denitrificans]|uniref:Two-component system, response regulator RegA n=1 Tax=Pseudoalteromonas denitrificans DSM 6059 TaxID=1123010 RepID=A0A1I1FFN9_9GAMM|nr:response regulator [Pseudoalteromonas denitrificans]SFB97776.1 two-component system, response regulator RegA [Pseudoalteromonas denitrificans DSM 6059]
MKLLIIEDDKSLAATLNRRFTKHGFNCFETHQADEVLHSCLQLKPTHILLDMKLIDESSLNLIKPIRAALPKVRLVLLTGFASITTAVEAMRLGADDYLAKPADTKMILKSLTGINSNNEAHEIETDTMSTERLEWEHIQQVLNCNEGNVSATARQLGMHRRTLQRKLQKKPVSK